MSELRLNTDGHIIKLGADNDVSLTHVADTGLLLNSTMKLQFNDASQFIQGSSATVLSIGATDEIDLTATAVDLNGTLNVSGVATFQATPVFPDGSLAVADLDIDGATDIGAAIVDADLFIVDDGAGGTNRKVTASRLKTYAGGAALANDGNNRVVTGDGSGGLNGEANLTFDGSALQCTGTLTVGADDTGHDVILYGATAGAKLFWDESADDLILDKTIFKMDQTDGNYIYLYRGGSKALVGTVTDEGDASGIGLTIYNSDEDFIFKYNNTTESFRIGASGGIFASATKVSTGGETGPDVSNGGLCLDQNALDTQIFSLKTSDVAHGVTTVDETDTYYSIKKADGATGGPFVAHYREAGELAMYYHATGTSAMNTDKNINNGGLIDFRGHLKGSGTNNDGTMTTNGNLFAIHSHNATRFILDSEGDLHLDGASNATAFDTHDDAQLVRAFDLSHGIGTINSKFDKFISYNHEKLAELKLVGREDDGTPNHFINISGMQRLHNGAIWQQYEKHNQLLEAVYELAEKAIGKKEAKAILDKHEVKRLQ